MPIEPIMNSTNHNQQNSHHQMVIDAKVLFKKELDKEREVVKTEEIENESDVSSKRQASQDETTTTSTDIDKNNVVIFTRYDNKGDVVNVVPPGYKKEA